MNIQRTHLGGCLILALLIGAFFLPSLSAQAAAETTYNRPLPAKTLIPGRSVAIAVQNFRTGRKGRLVLNVTQPAILDTAGKDVPETITTMMVLDGTLIGTNTSGAFVALPSPCLHCTFTTDVTFSLNSPITRGWHRLSITYKATPSNGDTGICSPYPQGCSPILLSRGRMALTVPRP